MASPDKMIYTGPHQYGFVKIRHPEAGEGETPAHMVAHWRARGWELVDADQEPDPEPSATTRAKRPTKE